MATTNHRVLYSTGSIIQMKNAAAVAALKTGIDPIKVLTMSGNIPKAAPFFITIDLPEVEPVNLFPLGKGNAPFKSSLLVGATVYDVTKLADLKSGTKSAVGFPVNHPQRKHKLNRIVKHQTFEFPKSLNDLTFTYSGMDKVLLVVQSVQKFFSDLNDPKDRKSILKDVPFKVE